MKDLALQGLIMVDQPKTIWEDLVNDVKQVGLQSQEKRW